MCTSVFMSMFDAQFCDDLAGLAACSGSGFPFSGCSLITPSSELHASDQPISEEGTVQSDKVLK